MTQLQESIIYITGGTGFIGSCLVSYWTGLSSLHRVVVQTRHPERCKVSDQVKYVKSLTDLEPVDLLAVVNLAGAPIADSRWTASKKKELEESRIGLTADLASLLAKSPPKVVVCASAIGFYGYGNSEVDESSARGDGYASELCDRWEAETKRFAEYSRLVTFRLGVVIGDGGVLAKLLPLYRVGLGGSIGSGKQWFSWVHILDVVSAIVLAIEDSTWQGVYNLTAPEPVRQLHFAKTLAGVIRRPCFMPMPAWVLDAVFGQMARELLLGGQRAVPARLEEREFDFRYPELKRAVSNVLELSGQSK